jgi:hypothetical protein
MLRGVKIFTIVVMLASSILSMLLACVLTGLFYPLLSFMLCMFSCIIVPLFCYDGDKYQNYDDSESNISAVEIGWFFTGMFMTSSFGLVGVLWRLEIINQISALLTLLSVGLLIIVIISMYWLLMDGEFFNNHFSSKIH